MYIFICICVCVARILVLIWLAFKLCVWCFCIKNWVKHCKNISLSFAVCRLCHAWSLVVWLLSCVPLLVTPWTAACQASLSFTISRSLLKLLSIESVMPSDRLVLCCPLLFLPSIFPSIRVFSSESALCIRRPEYCSFSFSISPSNEYSRLISFRMDWLNLLTVTLRSLLQYCSLKASVLRRSAFFMVQLSHPYMTTGKKL